MLNDELYPLILRGLQEVLEIDDNIPADEDLLNYGFNSIRMVEFVLYLEEKANIMIEDDLLLYDNFQNIEAIMTLIRNEQEAEKG
ncbi:acyl carrier protein [Paenibacillus oenotherae]|uniref:Acyl carrier protein n=1 Tax=Paenibacillus oenotherae TaxID=1435645 RepID=A0ABS7D589_9BACL|nr:acyl carrier protein [Paenibacillus oenotherae]MBW7475083.1 acyl carrier protein [Paenibacillus oenotherae]